MGNQSLDCHILFLLKQPANSVSGNATASDNKLVEQADPVTLHAPDSADTINHVATDMGSTAFDRLAYTVNQVTAGSQSTAAEIYAGADTPDLQEHTCKGTTPKYEPGTKMSEFHLIIEF